MKLGRFVKILGWITKYETCKSILIKFYHIIYDINCFNGTKDKI